MLTLTISLYVEALKYALPLLARLGRRIWDELVFDLVSDYYTVKF